MNTNSKGTINTLQHNKQDFKKGIFTKTTKLIIVQGVLRLEGYYPSSGK